MTRIALVLGGGASLGSYIAGAVTELIRAAENNRHEDGVRIDVIAGASAGALNAAVAARALTVNRHVLPWLERAWVDAADASVLLDPGRPARDGWLDVSALEELTGALVDAAPAADDEPSPAADASLRVGFTLTNLYGVRYDHTYGFLNAPERTYGKRTYADRIDFDLSARPAAGDPIWRELSEAAVASASFPFAFPPRRIGRSRTDYPDAHLAGTGDPIDMWYLDGGLFENAPLGLARDLVERDPDHRRTDRRYLFVEPSLQSSGSGPGLPAGPPRTLGGMAVALAGAVLGQGAVRDWSRANSINVRLEIVRAIVDRLPEVATELADPAAVAVGRYIGELAERVAEMQVASGDVDAASGSGDPVVDHLASQIERIESDPKYRAALDRVDSRAGRSRLAKLVFALEAAGDLQDKDVLPLYLVAPERMGSLAGDFLANFGGFFNREWRANDFRAGRRDARRVLEECLDDVIAYEPDADEVYSVVDVDAGFESIPSGGRAKLDSLISAEADRVLSELRPGPLASAFGWAWKPVVRRWVTERTTQALREAR
jgi:hypothetical protein